MTNKEFYQYYTDFDIIIDGMRLKLLEAMKKNPGGDYSQPNYTIEKLERLKLVYHTMYHQQQTVDNESGKVMQERHRLISQIAKLERENENLKKDIIL